MSTISACTLVPTQTPNPWIEQQRASEDVTYPIRPPDADEGATPQQIGAALQAGLGNYDVAFENAEALSHLSRQYNAILDAGSYEHERADHFEQMLREEERARVRDKLSYWALIGLIFGVAVTN